MPMQTCARAQATNSFEMLEYFATVSLLTGCTIKDKETKIIIVFALPVL